MRINCNNLTKRERDHRNNNTNYNQPENTKFYGKGSGEKNGGQTGNKQVFYSASPTLYKPDFPEDDETGGGFMTSNFNNHMLPGKHKFRYSMPLEYNDSKCSDPRDKTNKKYDDMNYNDVNYTAFASWAWGLQRIPAILDRILNFWFFFSFFVAFFNERTVQSTKIKLQPTPSKSNL